MVVYGCLWWSVVACCCLWLPVVVRGGLGWSVVASGGLWRGDGVVEGSVTCGQRPSWRRCRRRQRDLWSTTILETVS